MGFVFRIDQQKAKRGNFRLPWRKEPNKNKYDTTVNGAPFNDQVKLCVKNDEFCVKDDELCIKNDELYIKNDELCIENDECSH